MVVVEKVATPSSLQLLTLISAFGLYSYYEMENSFRLYPLLRARCNFSFDNSDVFTLAEFSSSHEVNTITTFRFGA
jgi:hypothetical protein